MTTAPDRRTEAVERALRRRTWSRCLLQTRSRRRDRTRSAFSSSIDPASTPGARGIIIRFALLGSTWQLRSGIGPLPALAPAGHHADGKRAAARVTAGREVGDPDPHPQAPAESAGSTQQALAESIWSQRDAHAGPAKRRAPRRRARREGRACRR